MTKFCSTIVYTTPSLCIGNQLNATAVFIAPAFIPSKPPDLSSTANLYLVTDGPDEDAHLGNLRQYFLYLQYNPRIVGFNTVEQE